ncbi:MAG: hypothetical protein MUE56_09335, partial [Ignavibacteria bacterium]|nr:hypothetical protein [Ignavibacteria bacterium]
MGKVDFQSHRVKLSVPVEKAYSRFFDLNNLQKLMPEQIVNWNSTEDQCSFDIKGMAHLALQRGECEPGRLVRIISGPDNPINLEIRGNFEPSGKEETDAWIELSAELSPMLQLMVSSPLQNLVNIMAEKIKE